MRTDLRGPESLNLRDRSLAASFARREEADEQAYIPLHDSSVEPEDFTGCYVLLASRSNSSPITGVAVNVDGGIGVRGFRTSAGGDQL
jgi:2,3-dihydroxy-2,3-dihydrophenylpropionate dehydrogenase